MFEYVCFLSLSVHFNPFLSVLFASVRFCQFLSASVRVCPVLLNKFFQFFQGGTQMPLALMILISTPARKTIFF